MKRLLILTIALLVTGLAYGVTGETFCDDVGGTWTYTDPETGKTATWTLEQSSYTGITGSVKWYCAEVSEWFTYSIESSSFNSETGEFFMTLSPTSGPPSGCNVLNMTIFVLNAADGAGFSSFANTGCTAASSGGNAPFNQPQLKLQSCAVPSHEVAASFTGWDSSPWVACENGQTCGVAHYDTVPNLPSGYSDHSFGGRVVTVLNNNLRNDNCLPVVSMLQNPPEYIADDYVNEVDDDMGWETVTNVNQIRSSTGNSPDCGVTYTENMQMDCPSGPVTYASDTNQYIVYLEEPGGSGGAETTKIQLIRGDINAASENYGSSYWSLKLKKVVGAITSIFHH